MTDLLVIVLIADAVHNAMAGDYHSVPHSLLLGATLIFWSFALDWLTNHWRPFGRFFHPPPLPIVKQGQLLRGNMRKELLTEDDVMAQVRQHGLVDLSAVKQAYLESDGRISVIPCEASDGPKSDRRVV